MIEPKFISENSSDKLSLDYDALRALGISYIEKYSGNQWTDYNYHDPGITLLEQLCYAITDLGYRTDFPISDVLLSQVDDFDLAQNNLLHGANEVFPTAPVTQKDLRKVLLDRVLSIRNVWVHPITNHPLGIDGLFELQVQLHDDIPSQKEKDVIKELKSVFSKHRSLSTDLEQITLLKKDELSLSGKIFIDSFMVGEDLLAQVYHKIEHYLNNGRSENSKDSSTHQELTEQLHIGPKLKNNGLKQLKSQDKTNEIYRSELIEIIENIPGITGLEDIIIYKNGVKCFDNIITFDKDCYPSLAQLDSDINASTYALKLYRNNYRYEVDASIFNQLFEALSIPQTTTFQELREVFSGIPRGRFSLKEIETYFSIQKELPSVYGLKENELPANSTRKRVAQARQLKAYLLIFEQVMANHLSQLTNIRELYSVDDTHLETYFSQVPTDVPHLKEVIDFDSFDSYLEYIQEINGTDQKKLERKHQFLDHLIARYGEYYDTSTIDKLDRVNTGEADHLGSLKAKMRYARSLISLGHDRNKAQVYSTKSDKNSQISGLQQRIELLLNIRTKKHRSTTSPVYNKTHLDDVKKKWVTKKIETDQGKSIHTYSIEDDNYSSEDFEFYCKNYSELKDLFINAVKDSNYQIFKTDDHYSVIFKRTGKQHPTKIYHSDSLEKCLAKKEKAIQRFSDLNKDCEGIYVLENLLLRPQLTDQYHLEITRNSTSIFKSIIPKDMESLEYLKEDVVSFCKDAANYSIVKESEMDQFHLVIYDLDNNAILKSVTTYQDKDLANDAITDFCEFFNNKSAVKRELKIELRKANRSSHQFPENFKYTNHINILCPDWPLRFQNKEFKDLLDESISEYIPAHLSHTVHYLTIPQMKQFEDIYKSWMNHFNKNDQEQKEKYALHLIQLLTSYAAD
jgi:hypothetical protein